MLLAHAGIVFVLKTLAIDDQITRLAPHQAFTPQIGHQPNHLPNGTTKYTGEGGWKDGLLSSLGVPAVSARELALRFVQEGAKIVIADIDRDAGYWRARLRSTATD